MGVSQFRRELHFKYSCRNGIARQWTQGPVPDQSFCTNRRRRFLYDPMVHADECNRFVSAYVSNPIEWILTPETMGTLILDGFDTKPPTLYMYNGPGEAPNLYGSYVRSQLSCWHSNRVSGFNPIDHIVVVECIWTDTGFQFNLDFETPDEICEEDGRAFMCKYASEENGWSMTPEAWLDMVMYPFIHQFPILRGYTPQTSVHIWTKRADDDRLCCPEHFSTVAYLQMKRVRNPRTEGKRIFTSLMDLLPESDMLSDNE
ncbi:uncharacterized protein TNCT_478211 [Trichonephila clavata]|uniref:Uncharacterized protein n=1 Tax=Trichonephila clavata TaxID=2740835 RepID=A0A8X6L9Z5_TRICU|nr:uncharacterized protein TNCT_478211 [Trichonephila clavata]